MFNAGFYSITNSVLINFDNTYYKVGNSANQQITTNNLVIGLSSNSSDAPNERQILLKNIYPSTESDVLFNIRLNNTDGTTVDITNTVLPSQFVYTLLNFPIVGPNDKVIADWDDQFITNSRDDTQFHTNIALTVIERSIIANENDRISLFQYGGYSPTDYKGPAVIYDGTTSNKEIIIIFDDSGATHNDKYFSFPITQSPTDSQNLILILNTTSWGANKLQGGTHASLWQEGRWASGEYGGNNNYIHKGHPYWSGSGAFVWNSTYIKRMVHCGYANSGPDYYTADVPNSVYSL